MSNGFLIATKHRLVLVVERLDHSWRLVSSLEDRAFPSLMMCLAHVERVYGHVSIYDVMALDDAESALEAALDARERRRLAS